MTQTDIHTTTECVKNGSQKREGCREGGRKGGRDVGREGEREGGKNRQGEQKQMDLECSGNF